MRTVVAVHASSSALRESPNPLRRKPKAFGTLDQTTLQHLLLATSTVKYLKVVESVSKDQRQVLAGGGFSVGVAIVLQRFACPGA